MPNLVGIGNSQAPTNSMLGGLAYQDSVGEIDIEKIKSQVSDKGGYSANDIFVYDTRKDSDGGAWRHRTQHTSWYNEGPSQGRGARKEFPVVAVLVTYNNGLRIHDGDDPNLPMWMEAWQYVNDSGGSTNWWGGSGTANKVVAMNGMIVMGVSLGTRNLHFINDRMSLSYSPATGDYTQRGGVANRNDSYGSWDRSDQYYTSLRNHTTNDVAITVLPNSMIDVSTGLPNPTFAVATDAGVTVRKSDFSFVDIYRTNDDDVHFVEFDGDRVIMAMELGAIYVATIPDADQSGNPNSAWTVYGTYSVNTSGTDWPYVLGYGAPDGLAFMKDHTFAVSGHVNKEMYKGLSITSENLNSPSNGMCAWIRKDSNTGWMHGNVKRAVLSSSDSTDLDRTNILGSLGTFASASGWSLQGAGSFSISGGKLNSDGTSGNSFCQRAETPAVITTGSTYTVKFTVTRTSGDVRVRVGNSSYGPTVNASGTYYHEIEAGTTPTETILFYGNSFNGTVDDVELYIQDQDRSRNNTGMTVVGTVPRTPVADGAELMAYGPFDSGSHLIQAYDSALDYGTGDFYYMIWINLSGHTPLQGIWSRQWTGQGSGNRIQFQTVGNGDGKLAIYAGVNQGSLGDNSKCGIGVWHHIAMVRRSGYMYWYKDGVQFSTYQDTTNYNNSGALLRLGGLNLGSSGQEYTTNHYQMSQGKIALFRTGSTAPSPEQLKKMYYDEKKLFEKNAKCSLYGTSNQVTAVAYDDTNDILHAGTSSGRSEFQGLNRINNTTTAVTDAISASDGLVAEQ